MAEALVPEIERNMGSSVIPPSAEVVSHTTLSQLGIGGTAMGNMLTQPLTPAEGLGLSVDGDDAAEPAILESGRTGRRGPRDSMGALIISADDITSGPKQEPLTTYYVDNNVPKMVKPSDLN